MMIILTFSLRKTSKHIYNCSNKYDNNIIRKNNYKIDETHYPNSLKREV